MSAAGLRWVFYMEFTIPGVCFICAHICATCIRSRSILARSTAPTFNKCIFVYVVIVLLQLFNEPACQVFHTQIFTHCIDFNTFSNSIDKTNRVAIVITPYDDRPEHIRQTGADVGHRLPAPSRRLHGHSRTDQTKGRPALHRSIARLPAHGRQAGAVGPAADRRRAQVAQGARGD